MVLILQGRGLGRPFALTWTRRPQWWGHVQPR